MRPGSVTQEFTEILEADDDKEISFPSSRPKSRSSAVNDSRNKVHSKRETIQMIKTNSSVSVGSDNVEN